MRTRAYRRHKATANMWRRLKEDRNQHYDNLSCPCWYDPRIMSKFKEQPKLCSCFMCRNPRRVAWSKKERLTMPERRQDCADKYVD